MSVPSAMLSPKSSRVPQSILLVEPPGAVAARKIPALEFGPVFLGG